MNVQKHPVLIVLALVIVLLIGGIFIVLQDRNPADERGTLTGNVVDAADSARLKGVTVTAIDGDGTRYTKHENTDTTGADGFFSLELPPGEYTLYFEADGYQPFESSASYKVQNGKTNDISEAFRLAGLADAPAGSAAGGGDPAVISEGEIPGEDAGHTEQTVPPAPVTVSCDVICRGPSGENLGEYTAEGEAGTTIFVAAPDIRDYIPDAEEKEIALSENESANVLTFYYESTVPEPEDDIPSDAIRYGGHSYYAYRTSSIHSFWDAESYCESLGGHLAVIRNEDINKALYKYVFDQLGYESAYFGLTDSGSVGDWYWTDGTPYGYRNWASGQPDNQRGAEHYALFYYRDPRYKWNDGDFGPDNNGDIIFLIEWDHE